MRGYACLNEFYEFLGIPKTDYGEVVGWSMTDGLSWVDFEHREVKNEDGTKYVALDMVFCPSEDFLEGWE